jgi:hypothetical protein
VLEVAKRCMEQSTHFVAGGESYNILGYAPDALVP